VFYVGAVCYNVLLVDVQYAALQFAVVLFVEQSQTVYWILAASKGWIKQTYRKILHTQNTQYTLYNIHNITSLEMI